MKRRTLISVCIVMVLSAMPAGEAAAQRRAPDPVQLERRAEGVYEILGGSGARGGLIVGDDGAILVDTKMDEQSMEQLMAAVRSTTDMPLVWLVNTHSDGDHVRGNRFVPEDVTIVAHDNCRAEFLNASRDGEPSEWNDPALAAFLPEITYRDRMTIHLGSRVVELWHFGTAHTTGDTVVNIPDVRTAFVADQIMMHRPQLIHSYKGGNSFGHVRNLRRMLGEIDADVFLTGHGEPVGREDILDHAAAMQARQARVRSLVAEGMGREQVAAAFSDDEANLVDTIFREISEGRDRE